MQALQLDADPIGEPVVPTDPERNYAAAQALAAIDRLFAGPDKSVRLTPLLRRGQRGQVDFDHLPVRSKPMF
jgi:hypothetical protein